MLTDDAKIKIRKLMDALLQLDQYKTTAFMIEGQQLKEAQLSSDVRGKFIRAYYLPSPVIVYSKHAGCETLEEALSQLQEWFSACKILPGTITVVTDKALRPNEELHALSTSVWLAMFDIAEHAHDDKANPDQTRVKFIRESLWAKLTGGNAGIKAWNETHPQLRNFVEYEKSMLNGAKLIGADLHSLKFRNSDFDNADLSDCILRDAEFDGSTFQNTYLVKANMQNVTAKNVDFTKSRLSEAKLNGAELKNAKFLDADLSKADFSCANIAGADFTGANTAKAKFSFAKYDQHTKLPPGLKIKDLCWNGKGVDPYQIALQNALNQGINSFDDFLAQLTELLDSSRVKNAIKMLKKESFDLFIDVSDQSISGLVKSQTDPDLIYACSINLDSDYSCGTQNLRPCGGLKGSLCKHILVLLLGLARADKVDMARTAKWIFASLGKYPEFDKKQLGQMFLKYQGATAGDIDWRPTETIPEDYYAF